MAAPSDDKTSYRPCPPTPSHVWTARCFYLTIIALGVIYQDTLQHCVNVTYKYLLSTWIFNSVYFESFWAVTIWPPILFVPLIMDKISYFHKYKLDPNMVWQDCGALHAIFEAAQYATPLMLMDTFMVKQYTGCGIDPSIWKERRKSLIQYTRELPTDPPTVFQIVWHIIVALILYDLMFYLVHVTLHKNIKLYKWFHATHHEHKFVTSLVTNKLTVSERIALVLSANQALRFVHAHPITRLIFVPIFLGWLTENHCGYDLPWTVDKVIPGKIIGGSATHYAHHAFGTRQYQPFFTYIDNFFSRRSASKTKQT